MKRVFIIHGWDFNPNMNWYPWLKNELENKGYKVFVPEMPDTSKPDIEKWISYLKKVVGKIDNQTYFIGHSIGCQTILRYLEKEDLDFKINKILFIAGWLKLDNLEDDEVKDIASSWIEKPIDFKELKEKINKLTVYLSDNEPYGCVKENKKLFQKNLDAKVIILKNKGHFTEEDGVKEIPEILNEF